MLIYPITGNSNLVTLTGSDHVVKVMFVDFSTVKLLLFPL